MDKTTDQKSISKIEYNNFILHGIDYNQYKIQMADDLLSNQDEQIKTYIKLNQSRMHRVEKTYSISEDIYNQLKTLKHKTYWLVLTEHWCGDASQNIPVFNAIAEASGGNLELKLVYRDQNPILMDAYLTNGTRSIPKLIQLDKHFNVTGIWGPRPSIAQKLVKELKSNPETAATYANELHLWYAKDKQKSLEKEIGQLLYRANLFCADCLI
ncbi:MAG: thioredoxin family protein [Bacteroidetes bacterium]|nr:thioredoxin family protein [Bacteroidota bacterium]